MQTRALTILRKTGVGLAGFLLLVFGLALIVLPGPAVVVIPLALALLATEFTWADRVLHTLTRTLARITTPLLHVFGYSPRIAKQSSIAG